MIRISNLTKRYGGFTAVGGIDLEVPRGELFGFLGPNGAGKTTTLRMIAGILRPTSGTVHIGDIDIAAEPMKAKSRLGYIPDRPFVYEKLTGAEFLRFVAGLYGQEGPRVEHRARELLALFDLEEWRDELVESYSHGMRQKLIISSAFVHRPRDGRACHQVAAELGKDDPCADRSCLVACATDPLESAGHRRRCLYLHHQIDGAHVDPELE